MNLGKCEIGTLASDLGSDAELKDQNIVKVLVEEKMNPGMFVKALDFVRSDSNRTYSKTNSVITLKYLHKSYLILGSQRKCK